VAVVCRDMVAPDRVVGHLCIEPNGSGAAEVALAVADAYQGGGIGHLLMGAGVAWADRIGIDRFTATMFAANQGIQRLLRGLGLPSRSRWVGPGICSMTIELAHATREAA
jgi:GNAT superfamily N-acetyltransferase